MKKANRNTFRVNVPNDTSIYMTYGKEWFKSRLEVLDLSEGGFCFISNKEVESGTESRVLLHFPWLDDPVETTIATIRVVKKEIEVKAEADVEGSENNVEEEPMPPKMKTVWEVACRFKGLTIGMQDRIYRQVRQLERRHIKSARDEAE